MLLELFITLQVLAVICFGIGFFRKSEWFWALSLVLTAILIFSSYSIEQNVPIVANQTMTGTTITYEYEIITAKVQDQTYSVFNIGLFAISLLLLMFDIFMNWKDSKSGARKL